jgi:hypothetical protein
MAYERSLISGFEFVNNSFGYELVCLYDGEREKKCYVKWNELVGG